MSVKVSWLGHATWLVTSDGHRLVIDPFLNDNPSATIKAVDVQADFVLLTHGHFDHVADAASIANRCQSLLVANYEIATWFSEKHKVKNTLGMNLGGTAKLPFGNLKMTIAFHSSQLPDGSYGGNPGGYIIEIGGRRLYFAGDTALFSDMQLIGHSGLDAAILPIGDLFTMGPADAVMATKLLGARTVFPSHYSTWPPIVQDAEGWAKSVREKTSSIPIVPTVGESVTV